MGKRYTLIWDTDSFCDGSDYDSLEAAKADGLDVLINWMVEQAWDYPRETSEWTQKQIEDWDYMIYNCSVSVRDNEQYNEEDFGEVWYPSDEECKEIGWVLYEEMVER